MSWQDDPIVEGASSSNWQDDPIVEQESTLNTMGRATARAGADFVSGVAGAIPDAISGLVVNPVLGMAGQAPMPSSTGLIRGGIDKLTGGYTEEKTPEEEKWGRVGRFATGLGGFGGAAGKVADLTTEGTKLNEAAKLMSLKNSGDIASTAGAVAGYGAGEYMNMPEAIKGATAMIGGMGGSAVNLVPNIQKSVKNLVSSAMDKWKIPLSQSQISNAPFAKTMQAVTERLPFTGAADFKEQQQLAYNRALSSTIGQKAEKLTPDVLNKAYEDTGELFEKSLSGKDISVTPQTRKTLDNLREEAEYYLEPQHLQQFNKNVDRFYKSIDEEGMISGAKLSDLRASFNKLQRGTQGMSKEFYGKLEDAVVDSITANDPEKKALLTQAKTQYKNIKTLEPIIDSQGNMSPARVYTAVNKSYKDFKRGGGGDIGELARIGDTFLAQKLPNSGTPERLAGLALLGESMTNPKKTLTTVAGGLVAGRGLNAVNTSQKLIKMGLKKEAEPETFPNIRNLLMLNANKNSQ